MSNELAIYPGTFDPVHAGHLELARTARDLLGVTVHLVPDAAPIHRPSPHFDHATRLDLLAVALLDERGLVADGRSATLAAPTRTLDLVRSFANGGPKPYLLLSDEIAKTLPAWEDPAGLARAARLVVFHRAGETPMDRRGLVRLLGPIAKRIAFIDTPLPDCRSTRIRAALATGQPLGPCVPPAVADALAALARATGVPA